VRSGECASKFRRLELERVGRRIFKGMELSIETACTRIGRPETLVSVSYLIAAPDDCLTNLGRRMSRSDQTVLLQRAVDLCMLLEGLERV